MAITVRLSDKSTIDTRAISDVVEVRYSEQSVAVGSHWQQSCLVSTLALGTARGTWICLSSLGKSESLQQLGEALSAKLADRSDRDSHIWYKSAGDGTGLGDCYAESYSKAYESYGNKAAKDLQTVATDWSPDRLTTSRTKNDSVDLLQVAKWLERNGLTDLPKSELFATWHRMNSELFPLEAK